MEQERAEADESECPVGQGVSVEVFVAAHLLPFELDSLRIDSVGLDAEFAEMGRDESDRVDNPLVSVTVGFAKPEQERCQIGGVGGMITDQRLGVRDPSGAPIVFGNIIRIRPAQRIFYFDLRAVHPDRDRGFERISPTFRTTFPGRRSEERLSGVVEARWGAP